MNEHLRVLPSIGKAIAAKEKSRRNALVLSLGSEQVQMDRALKCAQILTKNRLRGGGGCRAMDNKKSVAQMRQKRMYSNCFQIIEKFGRDHNLDLLKVAGIMGA